MLTQGGAGPAVASGDQWSDPEPPEGEAGGVRPCLAGGPSWADGARGGAVREEWGSGPGVSWLCLRDKRIRVGEMSRMPLVSDPMRGSEQAAQGHTGRWRQGQAWILRLSAASKWPRKRV